MKEFNFEGTLDIYSDDPHIFQPTSLKQVKEEIYDALQDHNIYIIAKTNMLYFHTEGMFIDKLERLSYFHLIIREKYGKYFIPIISPIPEEACKIEVGAYPHKEIHLLNKDGNIIRSLSVLNLIASLHEEDKLNFEVLYIGKSFGNKKKLNIINRLLDQNHKTLKRIIEDIHNTEPDMETYVLGYNFKYEKRLIGTNHNWIDTSFNKEQERIKYFSELSINRKYKIGLIEEALINYFAPKYNQLLKNSLNKLKSFSVGAFQKLDISGIIVELSTRETGIKLFSDLVPPKKLHVIGFAIQKDKERVNFFSESGMQDSREQNLDYLIEQIK